MKKTNPAPSEKAPGHYVRIIESATGTIEKEMGPHSERRAHKIADGAEINLNHKRFHVEVFEVAESA